MTAPIDDLGEEREVDLRSLRDRLLARWWLVVGGLALGIVVGVLVATGGGTVYDAKALVYLGQPFALGQQVASLSTNPRTVTALVRNEATIVQVAEAAGLTPATIRSAVSVQALTAIGQSAGLGRSTPLIELTVQLKNREKAELAANELATIVVDKVGGFVEGKITLLERRKAQDEAGLAAARDRIAAAIAQQQSAFTNASLPVDVRLLTQANANATLQFYEARSENLRTDLFEAEQALSLARNVELSRIVTEAVGAPTTARNRRNSAIVGGLIGLILGGLGASLLPGFPGRKRLANP
jgi:hypothetical protein